MLFFKSQIVCINACKKDDTQMQVIAGRGI